MKSARAKCDRREKQGLMRPTHLDRLRWVLELLCTRRALGLRTTRAADVQFSGLTKLGIFAAPRNKNDRTFSLMAKMHANHACVGIKS